MKKIIAVASLLVTLSTAAAAAPDQAPSLTHPAPNSRGVDALPRIATPKSRAATRINLALAKVDRNWFRFTSDCRKQGGRHWQANRAVETPMRGPAYLALVIRYDYDCGGAYPDTGTLALVYDLATGSPVNWARVLGGNLVDSASLDTAADGATMGIITSAALQAVYVKAAMAAGDADFRKDCADVLSDTLSFQLWPDAKAGGLMLEPSSLNHATKACGAAALIPLPTLKRLGVAPELLTAIDSAR